MSKEFPQYAFRPTKREDPFAQEIAQAVKRSGQTPSVWLREAVRARLESADQAVGDLSAADREAVRLLRKLEAANRPLLREMVALLAAACADPALGELALSFSRLALSTRDRRQAETQEDADTATHHRKGKAAR